MYGDSCCACHGTGLTPDGSAPCPNIVCGYRRQASLTSGQPPVYEKVTVYNSVLGRSITYLEPVDPRRLRVVR